MIDNTLAMRITREDKHYHSREMTLKDIFRKWLNPTDPLMDVSNPLMGMSEEQEVKE